MKVRLAPSTPPQWFGPTFPSIIGWLLSAIGGLLLSIVDPATAQAATGIFSDDFSTQSYSNNSGTANWSGPWIESGDDGSPTGADIFIVNGIMAFDNDDAVPPSISRTANLTGASQAVLSFRYFTQGSLDSNDQIAVEVFNGSTWTTLQIYSGATPGAASFDISSHIAANSAIRFRIVQGFADPGEFFIVDDVSINTSLENPDFNFSCTSTVLEIKALFILDDSGSVDANELALQRQAVLDTLDYFLNNNISAEVAIVRFSTNSSTVIDYTDVTLANRPLFVQALNTQYGNTALGAGNLTNWEAGFNAGLVLNSATPDMAFFFTDGTPNNGGSPEDNAQQLRDLGTHVYAIGIETLGDEPSTDIDQFRSITDGPDSEQFNGTNTTEADYLPIDDFTQLREEFSGLISTLCPIPNVLMVKRITAVNGDRTQNPNDGTPLNQFVDDTISVYQNDDNNPAWPSDYLIGEFNAGRVEAGDEIEYTVYFMNIGAAEAESVWLCDRIRSPQSFQLNAYGTGNDAQLELGTGPIVPNVLLNLTAADDGIDRAQLIPAGSTVPSGCNLNGPNDNGTFAIELTGTAGSPNLPTMPGSIGQLVSNNAYGSFRFVTKVDE